MQYQKSLAKFIKDKREERKITLNSFSFLNEIEPSTLSRIENGKLEIKIPILIKIAKGFDMTPAEFLELFEKTIK